MLAPASTRPSGDLPSEVSGTSASRSAQRRAGLRGVWHLGGHSSVEFVITNTGHAPCSMIGYPTISFVDAHRRPLAFHYQHNYGFFVTHSPPRSVLIPAGASAYAAAEKYRCDLGDKTLGRTTQVRLPGNAHNQALGTLADAPF